MRQAAIFLSLRSVSFDLLFLQECHLISTSESEIFSKGWELGPSVWGAGEGKGDGVGILFKSHEWVVESVLCVVPGRIGRVYSIGQLVSMPHVEGVTDRVFFPPNRAFALH